MNNIMAIAKVDITQILLQLKRNPQLWNRNPIRTNTPSSPHYGFEDIHVRFRDLTEYDGGDWAKFNGEHRSCWYKEADSLPAIKDLAFQLMTTMKGEELGGILISKIPPGGLCKPHTDTTWHAKYYDKYAVQLESHPDQAFCFEEGEHISPPGEVYWFNNQAVHWVRNNSPVDRITLIFCIKSDRRFSCLGE
jgi:hypothetical protein